jgi:hypothetical protein
MMSDFESIIFFDEFKPHRLAIVKKFGKHPDNPVEFDTFERLLPKDAQRNYLHLAVMHSDPLLLCEMIRLGGFSIPFAVTSCDRSFNRWYHRPERCSRTHSLDLGSPDTCKQVFPDSQTMYPPL